MSHVVGLFIEKWILLVHNSLYYLSRESWINSDNNDHTTHTST